MKKILVSLALLVSLLGYAEDYDKEYSAEEVGDINCKWVMVSLSYNNLSLAKDQYYSSCNNPTYVSGEGYSWFTFAVWNGQLDQVKWAMSLPGVNLNSKLSGVTPLYKTVVNIYHNNITDTTHDRYLILKLLLEKGADPLLHNDSEGHPPYSNGESTYELIKDVNMEDTPAGKLVIQYSTGVKLGK